MMTSSADLVLNFGCGSTGMPRPLSVTVRKPSASEFHLDPGGVAGDGLVHGSCRSPRRTGDAARARPCRRCTCRAGAARARGLPAPRCRRLCSCRRTSGCLRWARATGCFSCSLRLVVSDIQFQRLRGRRLRLLRRRPHQFQGRLRRLGGFCLRLLGSVRPAEQVAQGPECHERSPSLAGMGQRTHTQAHPVTRIPRGPSKFQVAWSRPSWQAHPCHRRLPPSPFPAAAHALGGLHPWRGMASLVPREASV